jgi:hypothetical protein
MGDRKVWYVKVYLGEDRTLLVNVPSTDADSPSTAIVEALKVAADLKLLRHVTDCEAAEAGASLFPA